MHACAVVTYMSISFVKLALEMDLDDSKAANHSRLLQSSLRGQFSSQPCPLPDNVVVHCSTTVCYLVSCLLRGLCQYMVVCCLATLPREATPDMLVKYRAGFGECVSEVARFLSTAEGLDPNNPRFIRLLNHLQLHGNRENPLPGAVAVESGSDANHKNGELPSLPSPGRGTADLKGSQPSPLGLVPPHAGVLPPVSLAAMAMLQQTVLQHQLAAAASLHQGNSIVYHKL